MGLKKDNLQPWEWLGTNMEGPILFPSSLNTKTVFTLQICVKYEHKRNKTYLFEIRQTDKYGADFLMSIMHTQADTKAVCQLANDVRDTSLGKGLQYNIL